MSWLYSRALAAEYSAGACSDGGQSAQSRKTPTPQAYLSSDKMTDFSRLSRFGMTFAPLTDDRGEAVLMSFRGGFPAKTSAPQAVARASAAQSPDCGQRCPELLARFDPDSRSWKIPTDLLGEDLGEFSETWPKSGTMRNGCAYQRESVVRPMSGRAYGFLPTPTAHNAKEGAYPAEYTRKTPTLATHAGGKINPEWTEWLMAWPQGWTDLKPSGMDRFREWLQQHSLSYTDD